MVFQTIFWISVLWLAYVYAGYPLLLALLGLFRRVRPEMHDDYLPSVSVLISARNEEKDIGWKVAETLAWDYPADRLEVLVASDASEDRTDTVVQGMDDSRSRLLRMERRGGKNRALNRLATAARGELLLFTDANSHIAPACLRRIVRHFADPRVGCVTGRSRSVRAQGSRGVGSGDSVYFSFEMLVKRLESSIGSVLVCDGAIFSIRRALFTPLFPELANDFELPLRIGAEGYWIRFESDAVVHEKNTDSAREEFARRRRICGQGALGMWRLRSRLQGLRAWQFLSQKFLRWLTLIPQLLLLCSSAALAKQPLFAMLFLLQLLFYSLAVAAPVLALTGRRACPLLSTPFYVLLSEAGALLGVFDACAGTRYDVWESPSLTRGGGEPSVQKI